MDFGGLPDQYKLFCLLHPKVKKKKLKAPCKSENDCVEMFIYRNTRF